ncbi:hypothetical protein Tco_1004286 [Tanacetum coccineum]|uniref:Uncharacterized protein n=1 Tax=Tanacetum coccineum TaxID=301880 RepID=A0ABQ5FCV6_9ASTR
MLDKIEVRNEVLSIEAVQNHSQRICLLISSPLYSRSLISHSSTTSFATVALDKYSATLLMIFHLSRSLRQGDHLVSVHLHYYYGHGKVIHTTHCVVVLGGSEASEGGVESAGENIRTKINFVSNNPLKLWSLKFLLMAFKLPAQLSKATNRIWDLFLYSDKVPILIARIPIREGLDWNIVLLQPIFPMPSSIYFIKQPRVADIAPLYRRAFWVERMWMGIQISCGIAENDCRQLLKFLVGLGIWRSLVLFLPH